MGGGERLLHPGSKHLMAAGWFLAVDRDGRRSQHLRFAACLLLWYLQVAARQQTEEARPESAHLKESVALHRQIHLKRDFLAGRDCQATK